MIRNPLNIQYLPSAARLCEVCILFQSSGFLPQSKHMQVKWTGDSKFFSYVCSPCDNSDPVQHGLEKAALTINISNGTNLQNTRVCINNAHHSIYSTHYGVKCGKQKRAHTHTHTQDTTKVSNLLTLQSWLLQKQTFNQKQRPLQCSPEASSLSRQPVSPYKDQHRSSSCLKCVSARVSRHNHEKQCSDVIL